jgi:MFS family permease
MTAAIVSNYPYERICNGNYHEVPRVGRIEEEVELTTDSVDAVAFADHGARGDDEDSFAAVARLHYRSTAAMCLCTFTHSWLLVSVFPYSGFMVIKLVPGTNEENAGSYAGLLAAAFMAGRTFTSYGWGKIADVYGRRVVLFLSLILSAFYSLLFGLSRSFWLAFLWRFLLGASNGIAGISKAIVSETARGNDTLETRGMSLSMGMWGWGFLLGPAVSGLLSDPVQQYPHLPMWENHEGWFYHFMNAYPFFLPNLISVLLCAIDLVAVELCVPETLPMGDRRNPNLILSDACNWLKGILFSCCWLQSDDKDDYSPLRRTNDGEFCVQEEQHEGDADDPLRDLRLAHSESVSLLSTSFPTTTSSAEEDSNSLVDASPASTKATMASLWSKRDTRNHLILYWIFSFVAIAIDEAFPLFCISKEGGLGLSENTIGKLLSATGLIFAVSQYHVYAWIVDKYGLCRSIEIGAILSAPLAALVPLSLLLNRKEEDAAASSAADRSADGSLTWSAFLYLSFLLATCRIFGLVFFSSITIATNRTVIPSHRGTMNGLSMLGGSCAKGLGPVVAGILVSFGISSGVMPPEVGAAVVFAIIGLCAALTAIMTVLLIRGGSCTEDDDGEEKDDTIRWICCEDFGAASQRANGVGGIAMPSA